MFNIICSILYVQYNDIKHNMFNIMILNIICSILYVQYNDIKHNKVKNVIRVYKVTETLYIWKL